MKKILLLSLIMLLALSIMTAEAKFKVQDKFSIEWTDETQPANRGQNDEGVLGWGGVDNYFQWDAYADIYKGDKVKVNFSFWNGWDCWYDIKAEKLDVEIEFNNSLNFVLGDYYTLTLGLRPVAKVALFENGSTNYINFTHAYFDTSLENVIKVPKIMDFNVKAYYRHKMSPVNVAAIDAWYPADYRNIVTGNLAFLFAIGSPGIWTGDVYRAYHIWDPTGAWQMGFKNNCGVWPMYSFGFGWMFNSIVQMDLNYRFARDFETGANAEYNTLEQFSVLQKIHVKMYLGVIQNISKIAGIKGFDIIVKAEQAVDMEIPYATGSELTKTIYTLGYYGMQLGWNGLYFDLMATLCTRDTYDTSRPLEKDEPNATMAWPVEHNRGSWQNPSAQLGFATKLGFSGTYFGVYGQYIGFAEVRKWDGYNAAREEKWTNYIKLGLEFRGF